MNKTVAVLCMTGLIAFGIIGALLIAILRPDASATFIAFVGTITGFALLAIMQISNNTKAEARLDRIEKAANGTNTALLSKVTGHPVETIKLMKGEGHGES